MNKKNWRTACVGLGIAASAVAANPARAEEMEATFSLPTITFSFVPVYVAEDQALVGSMIKDEVKLSSFESIHTNAYVK